MALEPPTYPGGVYRNTAEFAALQQDLAALRESDKDAERTASTWGWAAIGAGVLAIVLVFAFVMAELGEAYTPAFMVVEVLLVVAVITCGAASWYFRQGDVEDRRYEFLSRVLRLIERDTVTGGKASIVLDLRSPDHKSKFDRKGKAGRWNVKYYLDPWLSLQGRLMDGTAYRLVMIEKHQYRSRWKTNARGKTKHKSKTKSATEAVLRLRVKPSRYPNLAAAGSSAASAVQMPQWCGLKDVQVGENEIVLRVQTSAEWDVATPTSEERPPCDGDHMAAMMFLSCYHVLSGLRAKGGNA
ncbi:MAG: hypothetical protein N2C14_07090 [Planctomycetales bacterium]